MNLPFSELSSLINVESADDLPTNANNRHSEVQKITPSSIIIDLFILLKFVKL